MKKFSLILVAPVLLSFAAFTTEPENDLKEDGLKGEVKSVTSVSYGTRLMFDELVKGDRTDSTISTYNAGGMRTSIVSYHSSKYLPDYELRYQFNPAGKKTREELNYQGAYDYDREFIYDQSGNVIETNDYSDDGKLKSKTKHKYHSNGKIFHSTEYFANGDRRSRKYRYYDAAGNLNVRVEVDGRNVVQKYVVNVFDELNRLTRQLTYDGCLQLERTTDYFYTGNSDEYSAFIYRDNPIEPLPDDTAMVDDNGKISKPGCTFKTDEYGVITECTYSDTEETQTDVFEHGVLRKSTTSRTDGSRFAYTYNKYGDTEQAEMNTNELKSKVTCVYNSVRSVTTITNVTYGSVCQITYDQYNRMSAVKLFETGNKLTCNYSVSYDSQGNLTSSFGDYTDPAQKDEKEEYKMENGRFKSYYEPTWWAEGMMHTVVNYSYVFNETNEPITAGAYAQGNASHSQFSYKLDAKGNWIYRLETEKETGKPVEIIERKIYYR